MKILIKAITNPTNTGVTLELTGKAALNGRIKIDKWYVSWDKIGKALFGEQYSDTPDVDKLQTERGENENSES